VGRHELVEVEVLRLAPSCLPLGPVARSLAPEEAFPPGVAGELQEHAQSEEVSQLRPRAVGAVEDDDGRGSGGGDTGQGSVVGVPS